MSNAALNPSLAAKTTVELHSAPSSTYDLADYEFSLMSSSISFCLRRISAFFSLMLLIFSSSSTSFSVLTIGTSVLVLGLEFAFRFIEMFLGLAMFLPSREKTFRFAVGWKPRIRKMVEENVG